MISPFYQVGDTTLYLGDCIEVMAEMEENSVDAVVCDPPYGLEFMGKEWDRFRINSGSSWSQKIATGKDWKGQERQRPSRAYFRSRHETCSRCGRQRHQHNDVVCSTPEWEWIVHEPLQLRAYQEWSHSWATQALRVLKPGGFLLAFGGTRTSHRLVCGLEDAGFEVRDTIAYYFTPEQEEFINSLDPHQQKEFERQFVGASILTWNYGSGFPKSLSIDKAIDSVEKNTWLNIGKALDNLDIKSIIGVWKINSNSVKFVEISYQRNISEIGMSTPKSGTVHGLVLINLATEKSLSNAIIAELRLIEACLMSEENIITAQESAEVNTIQSLNLVIPVEWLLQNQEARQSIITSIAQCVAKDLPREKVLDKIKEDEALKTWFGKRKSLSDQDISVLCAGLVDGLKHTILSQSKIFQNLDTKSQTDYVYVTSVTITESTAENLISFMVDILKTKQIDKMAGAEREVVGEMIAPDGQPYSKRQPTQWTPQFSDYKIPNAPPPMITTPATEAAKEWQGWGTALKPAFEPICVARKPLSEKNVASNVLRWGTGGLDIDGARIGMGSDYTVHNAGSSASGVLNWNKEEKAKSSKEYKTTQGRYPANVILEEVLDTVLTLQYNIPEGVKIAIEEYYNDYIKVSELRKGNSYLPKSIQEEKVLQQDLLSQSPEQEIEGCESSTIRQETQARIHSKNETIQEVINKERSRCNQLEGWQAQMSGVCDDQPEFINSLRTEYDEGNGQSWQKPVHPRTSSSDGQDFGEATQINRSGASQERNQRRQSTRKPTVSQRQRPQEAIPSVTQGDSVATQGKRNSATCSLEVLEADIPISWLKYFTPTGELLRIPNCPCRMLDDQSGELKGPWGKDSNLPYRNQSIFGAGRGHVPNEKLGLETGGASRFFYCPKSSRSERGEGNTHPTCKPIKLMEYLIKLVSRDGALILDPFVGSGTTLLAARNLGRRCVGIEQSEEYCDIAKSRLEKPWQGKMT